MTISPFRTKHFVMDKNIAIDHRFEDIKKELKQMHDRIEYCITHFESANDNETEVSVGSFKMVMYEMSEKLKQLGEKYE
jgi:molecular chaperone GrpE (heat shock protein)